MTTNLVKLTKFDTETDWENAVPTTTEKLSDVWINPKLVQLVQIRDYVMHGKDDDACVPKILITFGMDMDIYVNETLDEVLNILQGRI